MTVLDEIIAGVRADLDERRAHTSLAQLAQRVDQQPRAKDALAALAGPTISVIAEVKRASPSKGALADIPDPAALAGIYESGGASAISVLTERRRFSGSLADLDAVRQRVELPVLRKDFMVSTYQIWEARAHGADLILLIVAALDDDQLSRYLRLAHDLGMTALVEAHDLPEAERALGAGAHLIGVNARNLKTLEVDPDHACRVLEQLPEDVTTVGESGIATTAEVQRYAEAGASAVLVGETLVRSGDPAAALAAFSAVERRPHGAR
ncbi:MAG: indole-3-glycerol phosphate synthase TrpC [Flaviflexus sp.]|nr:indole-3-glycerol phosphate synthase TrpC [Flaviflexus sp.]